MKGRNPASWRIAWAVVLLLALVLVPHHHHDGGVPCVAVEICHHDGALNDEHTGHGERGQAPVEHTHYLRPLVVKTSIGLHSAANLPNGCLPSWGLALPRPVTFQSGVRLGTPPLLFAACSISRHHLRRGPPVC